MTTATAHVASLAQQRIEVIALAVVICAMIFELLRRKRLMERYAILWFAAGVTLLVLALWKGLLTNLAHAAGIHYLPSALFAVAFLFVFVMLVHSSMTVSRLSDHNTTLAQRLALMQRRLEQLASLIEQRGELEDSPDAAVTDELHAARTRRRSESLSSPQVVPERRKADRRAAERRRLIKRDRIAE
jgi:hypothetical protein